MGDAMGACTKEEGAADLAQARMSAHPPAQHCRLGHRHDSSSVMGVYHLMTMAYSFLVRLVNSL